MGAEIGDHLAPRLIVQGIPRSVVGGKVPGLKQQFAERSAVCAEGSVVTIVVSTKKLPGLDLSLPGGWGVLNALVVTPGKR